MSNVQTIVATKDSAVGIPEYGSLEDKALAARRLVDDIVLKNYITKLTELGITPLDDGIKSKTLSAQSGARLFKINEMVYQKDEYSTYKFASVFNAVQNMDCTVFVIADSDGDKTEFYMGVRSNSSDKTSSNASETLRSALTGQFLGANIAKDDSSKEELEKLLERIKRDKDCIASVSCVANNKDEEFTSNENFLQGLEKLVLAMRGQKYTAIIVADSVTSGQLNFTRQSYENIYSQLSPLKEMQLNYGVNESRSLSDAFSSGTTVGTSHSDNTSHTSGENVSSSTSKSISDSEAKGDGLSTALKGAGLAVSIVGTALAPFTGGISMAAAGIANSGLGLVGALTQKTKTHAESTTDTYTTGSSTSDTVGQTDTTNESQTDTTTRTDGTTTGTSNSRQLTMQNKSIMGVLERIDTQLKRLQECESVGMWECAAYFLSKDNQSAEIAAATYKALVKGENSGVEMSAVNCWRRPTATGGKESVAKIDMLGDYITNFVHPKFLYGGNIPVTPASLVSGNELAIHMGLPRKSVCGLPVIEYADFGKEVVRNVIGGGSGSGSSIKLGKIFNMGMEQSNLVELDIKSLAMHTFVTGSTGSGKSNTVYEMLERLMSDGKKFLVIEPAKGEYKNVFGNRDDVKVLGTNPKYSELLRINPFRFPPDIHVLEHTDRLIEIFNVCWPMYAAMPAILKDAVLRAYEVCGWDMTESTNRHGTDIFPTFADLQAEIRAIINDSSYSQEMKGNYVGALETRVKSLTNGLNGQIFSANETDNEVLFDENVIVDLSRVGSLETKSLIMGILVMRLNEHRVSASKGKMNQPLKHITVLEEAHNILKRTSTEQNPEGSNMTGKSVELLSNSIAEMRTYGEGFIIADQSPNAVDMSAIRNTNTKIIMRLPDEADRRLAGKAAALKEEQLDEIAKLSKGVAVVYQNDWLEPVLCKINKFDGEEKPYEGKPDGRANSQVDREGFNLALMKLIVSGNTEKIEKVDVDVIKRGLERGVVAATQTRLKILGILKEYDDDGKLGIWERLSEKSKFVSEILNCGAEVESLVSVRPGNGFSEFKESLMRIAKAAVPGLSDELALEVCHCFMCVCDGGKSYNSWIKNFQ